MSDGGDVSDGGDGMVVRERIRVGGVVQGVGFRPFVRRVATQLGLSGFVGNDVEGVLVEVEGPAGAVDELARRLRDDAPPRAVVTAVERSRIAVAAGAAEAGFRIEPSTAAGGVARTLVPPDIGVCDACTRELFDRDDRRHRHPFITCTDCGPRYTIIERLPYDRPHTTMAAFPMCDACAAEYADPGDRRHHAQPLCCPACGPRLSYEPADGPTVTGDEACVAAAVAALRAGRIVAVKGIGGYHLAVRADDEAAVRRLRHRKQRGDKPFAVMARDLGTVRRFAEVDDVEAAVLAGPVRPIVLLRRRGDGHATPAPLAEAVAPASPLAGVVLPYTGLHHLLVHDGPAVLVMTSGNVSEEPIVHDDADARDRLLGPLADALLTHDRPIHVPCDDSVVRVLDGTEVPLRRSRGVAPLPVRLPVAVPPLLAVGGDLKAVCCLAEGRDAWLSQHLGDLENLVALAALERTVDAMGAFHGIRPERVVADLHPRYLGRRWATDRHPRVVGVQHHLAHVAAVMAEHGVDPGTEVTGVAMDGTGYGLDGTIWGGEAVRGTYATLGRVAHLAPRPLPGGDGAIRHPARVAVALLRAAGLEPTSDLPPVRALGAHDVALLGRQLDRGVACVPSSSMGRLFDAVASLVGLCHEAGFEAQAAMALEAAADRWEGELPEYRFSLGADGVAAPEPVIRAVVADVRDGLAVEAIAAGFHAAVAELIVRWAERSGLPTVALSGGVFQNAVLVRRATAVLRDAGFAVLTHRLVPPNDGGLALGQAVLGALADGRS